MKIKTSSRLTPSTQLGYLGIWVLGYLSLLLLCGCTASKPNVVKPSAAAKKTSEYPNKSVITNGSWLFILAETGVTNYNISWTQLTNQLWDRILVNGGIAATNVLLSPIAQTNYTLAFTNSIAQEIITANTNVSLLVTGAVLHAPVNLWVNAQNSTINALLTLPASCRTNLDFVSTITNGTARAYHVEYRSGTDATNLWIISSPSAIR